MDSLGRKIVTCSEEPRELDGNTIYVVKREESANIRVFSGESFGYKNFSMISSPRMEVQDITNSVGDLRGYWRVPLPIIMGALIEENDIKHTISR